MSTNDRIPVEVVCLRYGLSAQKKKLVVFKEVDAAGVVIGDEICLQRSSLRNVNPGHCYHISCTPDKRQWYTGTCKWSRMDPDEDRRVACQVEANAQAMRDKEEALIKRENTPTAGLDKHIRSLRYAYRKLSPADRLPFELWLLNQIRRYE